MDMINSERGEGYWSVLYPWINSYYEESLALLRVDNTLREDLNKKETEFELDYLVRRAELDDILLVVEDPEAKGFLSYQASMLLKSKRDYYERRGLEKNVFTLGTIVQFLSLLESTMHSLYEKLIQLDQELSGIKEICKRDKGIIKYLKYFEKALISNPKPVLVGTSDFQELIQWISFRNNIVHNNNDLKQDLVEVIDRRKLESNTNMDKFVFNGNNIQELAALCGKIIDVLIEKLLKPYLLSVNALKER